MWVGGWVGVCGVAGQAGPAAAATPSACRTGCPGQLHPLVLVKGAIHLCPPTSTKPCPGPSPLPAAQDVLSLLLACSSLSHDDPALLESLARSALHKLRSAGPPGSSSGSTPFGVPSAGGPGTAAGSAGAARQLEKLAQQGQVLAQLAHAYGTLNRGEGPAARALLAEVAQRAQQVQLPCWARCSGGVWHVAWQGGYVPSQHARRPADASLLLGIHFAMWISSEWPR